MSVRLRTWPSALASAIVGGTLFGFIVSAVNGAEIPALVPLSLVIGVGWFWAAVAFLLGRLAVGRQRSAVVGGVVLVFAVCAYYVTDVFEGVYEVVDYSDPTGAATSTDWSAFGNNALFWSVISLFVGPFFGVMGMGSRRGDVIGLMFKLALPAIAAVEMVFRLRYDMGLLDNSIMTTTWIAVLISALAIAVGLVVRHLVRLSSHPGR
ncbi:MAG TPA: hypothetical protein VNO31_36440 [Umezawaea sp.]|nr:hypothetical protein [Umezawaea sp.]